MHIPSYAHDAIRAAALLNLPSSQQVGGLHCCLCDEPFGEGRAAVPLGPTPKSGLCGCRSCLTRLITRARRDRDAALAHDAKDVRAEGASWNAVRERHLAQVAGVRQAAEAVAGLVRSNDTQAMDIAWLLISLESAYNWIPHAPEQPASVGQEDRRIQDEAFRLDLAMMTAREAVASRLAYHLLNQAGRVEPEMCEEFECPEGCLGRHDATYIDCGADAVFDDLAKFGIALERVTPDPLAPRFAAPSGVAGTERKHGRFSNVGRQAAAALRHVGIDTDDTESLVSAAAVGLVIDAWREGPLDEVWAVDGGLNSGEILVQSVDLYRRARTALATARTDGPEALLALVAVASDVDLPWAGGTRLSLRALPGSMVELVQHVNDQVCFTAEMMRERGWRAGLLHRAASAAFKAPTHFGMPGWPSTVSTAMERLAPLDRSGAPEALVDLAFVETSLLEAPERLGVDALDWISRLVPLGW
ncbi:hypothetical protein AB0M36_09705 [Actinoplanes sp. NPDC051346]|uniref:hypothetical protein n=1 Tax=Actinoplanes sp. NPDC051346 TaxID=3155048 RepID=UPI00341598AD